MARIPDTELDRLKHDIPIAALVDARGVVLHQQGADLVGSCPFHQDDTPSLHLSVEKCPVRLSGGPFPEIRGRVSFRIPPHHRLVT